MKHSTLALSLVFISTAFLSFAQDSARVAPANTPSSTTTTTTTTTAPAPAAAAAPAPAPAPSTVNQSSSDGGDIRVGLKVSPGTAFGRVIDKDSKDGYEYSADGSDFGLSFGPTFEFPMVKENVYFTTGIWFSLKSIKVRETTLLGTSSSKYNLQYLTVPLTFKFYTNEIARNMRLYFNMGGTFDIKIAESVAGTDNVGLKNMATEDGKKLFLAVDGNFLLGTGLEFNLGQTTLFAGVSYLRGLVNVVNSTWTSSADDRKPYTYLALKNNSVTLDLGIQF